MIKTASEVIGYFVHPDDVSIVIIGALWKRLKDCK